MSGDLLNTPAGAARALRSTVAVRARARQLLGRARAAASEHFVVNDGALVLAASTVAELTRARYPGGRIPYHSRWRHFEAGGVDRKARLDTWLGPADAAARARAQIDLVLVSVLLDAGAGADWSYLETASGQRFTRSEGLGVASLHAFAGGLFSSDPLHPLRVDATGLQRVTAEQLGHAFHVRRDNPLVGLEGRAALLRRLGGVMAVAARHLWSAGPAGWAFRRAGRAGRRCCGRARHPGVAAGNAVGHLARAERHRRRAAGRLLAPPGRGGRRVDRGVDALPQALAMARPTRCSNPLNGRVCG